MALITAISATGQLVRSSANSGPLQRVFLHNVGTVAIAVYFTADGSGDPVAVLAGGVVNDDGLGSSLSDSSYNGPVWAKAPATGGRLLAI